MAPFPISSTKGAEIPECLPIGIKDTTFRAGFYPIRLSDDLFVARLVGYFFLAATVTLVAVLVWRRIQYITRTKDHDSAPLKSSQPSGYHKRWEEEAITSEVRCLQGGRRRDVTANGKPTGVSSATEKSKLGIDNKICSSPDPSDWESFLRTFGPSVVDYAINYHKMIASRPVRPNVKPGFLKEQFSSQQDFPTTGEKWSKIMSDLEEYIIPHVLHWQHPRFFGWFPMVCSPPSVLADFLMSAMSVMTFSWESSPASAELEVMVMDSLARAIGLPETFTSSGDGGGALQGSATESVLYAIIGARTRGLRHLRRMNPDVTDLELMAKMTLYASDQAHSSVEKAANVAGLGWHFRKIPSHEGEESSSHANSMDVEKLASCMEEDRAKGLTPVFVCATVGTTSSCAVDPVRAIAEVCRTQRKPQHEGAVGSADEIRDTFVPWFHIDAAYAGAAALCEEYRWILDGVEYADSFLFSPHKWLLVNAECAAMWVRHKADFTMGLTMNPEYLKYEEYERGEVTDFKDWQLSVSRRFRSLKLWITIRTYGLEKIRELLRLHIHLAQELASLIRKDLRFEIVAPVRFGLVCFRLKGSDAANLELRSIVNSSGRAFFSYTKVRGRVFLRICVGGIQTQARDIREVWEALEQTADLMEDVARKPGKRTSKG